MKICTEGLVVILVEVVLAVAFQGGHAVVDDGLQFAATWMWMSRPRRAGPRLGCGSISWPCPCRRRQSVDLRAPGSACRPVDDAALLERGNMTNGSMGTTGWPEVAMFVSMGKSWGWRFELTRGG